MCNRIRRGGEISVSVKDGLKFRVVEKSVEDLLQIFTLQIQTNSKDFLNITALYKSPQMPHNMFFNKLTDHFTAVGYLSGSNLLCGDFNLNMLLPTNESTSPTRTTDNTATSLDVFCSDFECNIHVQYYHVSDHSLVKLKMPNSLTMNSENGFRRRNGKKFEREDFKLFFNYKLNIAPNDQKQNLHLIEFNSAFILFNSVLETTLDTFLPLKFNKAHIKHRDWIDNDVKKATNSKQQFWLRYKNEPTLTNFWN